MRAVPEVVACRVGGRGAVMRSRSDRDRRSSLSAAVCRSMNLPARRFSRAVRKRRTPPRKRRRRGG